VQSGDGFSRVFCGRFLSKTETQTVLGVDVIHGGGGVPPLFWVFWTFFRKISKKIIFFHFFYFFLFFFIFFLFFYFFLKFGQKERVLPSYDLTFIIEGLAKTICRASSPAIGILNKTAQTS
jgi:hypothetical protein